MYARQLRLINCGPIRDLSLSLPFEEHFPKPVVVVGKNGSGKSVLLSHIINGLILAKDKLYPDSSEIESGRVFKLRSPHYITSGCEYYYGRVDYDNDFFITELQLRQKRDDQTGMPTDIVEDAAQKLWQQMSLGDGNHFDTNLSREARSHDLERSMAQRCVLYLPPDRYEEPAWLNEESLTFEARTKETKRLLGHTDRRLIASSPLRANLDWLYEVVYDRAAFETQLVSAPVTVNHQTRLVPSLFYSGQATVVFETVLRILRVIMDDPNARLGIGPRQNRVVSVMSGDVQMVPSVFQLSSGEMSLLNLGLSILRDYDLCDSASSPGSDHVEGTVVIDEIELHLHAFHQYEVLPRLLRMFPRVQFIVTSHSPLFILGMQKTFGDDGFALYEMPNGHQITGEEFSEFANAYSVFATTRQFMDDMRSLVKETIKPMLLVEGSTDKQYIERAAFLLGRQDILEALVVEPGGGGDNLLKMWKGFTAATVNILPHKIMLLLDCDKPQEPQEKNILYKRSIPLQQNNPVKLGIENLFSRTTLEQARQTKSALVDIAQEHSKTVRGQEEVVPEMWTVNSEEKRNLCDWLCENGGSQDFQGFQVVFEMLDEVFDLTPQSED